MFFTTRLPPVRVGTYVTLYTAAKHRNDMMSKVKFAKATAGTNEKLLGSLTFDSEKLAK